MIKTFQKTQKKKRTTIFDSDSDDKEDEDQNITKDEDKKIKSDEDEMITKDEDLKEVVDEEVAKFLLDEAEVDEEEVDEAEVDEDQVEEDAVEEDQETFNKIPTRDEDTKVIHKMNPKKEDIRGQKIF